LAAEIGIRQFLDIGAGLPTMDNVHQVVQRAAPDARVVYVDHDPDVIDYAGKLAADISGVGIVDKDLRDPAGVLGHQVTQGVMDFSRPIGLFLVSILTDGALTMRSPEQITAFFDGLELLAPGVVNVATWRPVPGQPVAAAAGYDESQGGYLGGIGHLAAPQE
jgi:hypothetical protein